jgi:hypothetical protein
MKKGYVPISSNDREFAKAIIELAESAKKEIIYASGEGSTLLLPGVMEAGDDAALRGAIIRGYLAKPDIRILGDVVAKHELYLGRVRPEEHFYVIDRRHYLSPISHEEGRKEGWIHWDDEEGAKGEVKKFEALIGAEEVIRSPFGQAERFYKEALEEFEEGKRSKAAGREQRNYANMQELWRTNTMLWY